MPSAPQTLENTREKDETMVAADDEEVAADEAQDEFAGESLSMTQLHECERLATLCVTGSNPCCQALVHVSHILTVGFWPALRISTHLQPFVMHARSFG